MDNVENSDMGTFKQGSCKLLQVYSNKNISSNSFSSVMLQRATSYKDSESHLLNLKNTEILTPSYLDISTKMESNAAVLDECIVDRANPTQKSKTEPSQCNALKNGNSVQPFAYFYKRKKKKMIAERNIQNNQLVHIINDPEYTHKVTTTASISKNGVSEKCNITRQPIEALMLQDKLLADEKDLVRLFMVTLIVWHLSLLFHKNILLLITRFCSRGRLVVRLMLTILTYYCVLHFCHIMDIRVFSSQIGKGK